MVSRTACGLRSHLRVRPHRLQDRYSGGQGTELIQRNPGLRSSLEPGVVRNSRLGAGRTRLPGNNPTADGAFLFTKPLPLCVKGTTGSFSWSTPFRLRKGGGVRSARVHAVPHVRSWKHLRPRAALQGIERQGRYVAATDLTTYAGARRRLRAGLFARRRARRFGACRPAAVVSTSSGVSGSSASPPDRSGCRLRN